MRPLLHLGSNVITDGPLLHLGPVITLLPSTSSTDKTDPDLWSEFGLRGNQTFSLPWWHFQGSHISSLTWDQDMCHLYQSVNKAKGKSENLSNVVEIKGEKKNSHFSFVGREELRIP